jgi:hypothetical protein
VRARRRKLRRALCKADVRHAGAEVGGVSRWLAGRACSEAGAAGDGQDRYAGGCAPRFARFFRPPARRRQFCCCYYNTECWRAVRTGGRRPKVPCRGACG